MLCEYYPEQPRCRRRGRIPDNRAPLRSVRHFLRGVGSRSQLSRLPASGSPQFEACGRDLGGSAPRKALFGVEKAGGVGKERAKKERKKKKMLRLNQRASCFGQLLGCGPALVPSCRD